MAIPRVFISSTFYDLKQVRDDLERFIKELGYEPVRHEAGAIPYGKDEKPEKYAYREVELCDILISIIGGRYGTESSEAGPYSISQQELRTAIERGVQVFIFIERSVYAEYSTYKLNKDNENVKYSFVDDPRVYQFIEEVHSLPSNNPIAIFDTSSEIVRNLQAQWAGLFQRFLQEQQRLSEIRIIDEMKNVASTLRELVDYLTASGKDKDAAIQSILTINHPAFRRFAEVTNTTYRIIFTDKHELDAWLTSSGYAKAENQPAPEWVDYHLKRNPDVGIRFVRGIFDSRGKLKIFSPQDWDNNWVDSYDRDIPF